MHVKEAIGLIQAPRPQDDPIGFGDDTVRSHAGDVRSSRAVSAIRRSRPQQLPRGLVPSHRVTLPLRANTGRQRRRGSTFCNPWRCEQPDAGWPLFRHGRNPLLPRTDPSTVPLRHRAAVGFEPRACRRIAGMQARALPLRRQCGRGDPGFRIGRHAAAPGRHASAQLRLRAAHAGDDIDGAGQCFWFVAVPATRPPLPLQSAAASEQQSKSAPGPPPTWPRGSPSACLTCRSARRRECGRSP